MDTESLLPGAIACIKQCANIEAGDKILIITDKPIIADALSKALVIYTDENKIKTETNTFYLPDSIRPVSKINKVIKDAILSSDIIFTPFSAEKDESIFRREILKLSHENGNKKIFHMVSVTETMFQNKGSLALNDEQFNKMNNLTEKMAVILSMAKKVKITAGWQNETNVEFGLGSWNNTGIMSTGIVNKGSWGNLPSGEAFIIPKDFSGGKIVIDTAITYFGPLLNPIYLEVTPNGLVNIEKNGSELGNLLKKYQREAKKMGIDETNVMRICEFGIGTNPNIIAPSKEIIEIEKILGTVHIAIGDNRVFGGDIKAPCHLDMVLKKSTIIIDDHYTIMKNGDIKNDSMNSYLNIDYKSFDVKVGLKDKIRVFSENIAKAVNGKLCRHWEDSRKNTYCQQIGCNESAEMAKKMWECIDKIKTEKVSDIRDNYESRYNEIDKNSFLRIISLMERFGVLRILGSRQGEYTHKVA